MIRAYVEASSGKSGYFDFPIALEKIYESLGTDRDYELSAKELIFNDFPMKTRTFRHVNVRDLNVFAEKLSEIPSRYYPLMDYFFDTYGLVSHFNTAFDLNNFYIYQADTDEILGYAYLKEQGFQLPQEFSEFFDYKSLGLALQGKIDYFEKIDGFYVSAKDRYSGKY